MFPSRLGDYGATYKQALRGLFIAGTSDPAKVDRYKGKGRR
jgi:hypothetical protein